MWSAGIDQSSLVPAADQILAFNNNFAQLRSLFWTQGNLGSALGFLTRRWYLTQNGVTGIVAATAQAEIAGTMQPTMAGRTKADFTVDLLLADPYFYGAPLSTVVPANGAVSQITNLGDGAIGFGQAPGNGGQAFTITLTGPLTLPLTLSNVSAGVSVTLGTGSLAGGSISNNVLPAGHFITLDVLSYTAYDDTGFSCLGRVAHAGARPWMLLLPLGANGFVNQLVLTTGSGGDTGRAALSYSPPYL